MTGKIFTGALVSAFALFIWGFLFWGVFDIASATYDPVPNDQSVIDVLRSSDMPSGTYMYPLIDHTGMTMSDSAAMPALEALHRTGPVFEIRYRRDGVEMMSAATMVWGFVHILVSTLIAALLLRMALPALGSYGRRVAFVTVAGTLGAVFTQLGGPIWFYYPWDRALLDLGYGIASWLIAGLVLAAFIMPHVTRAPVVAVDHREAVAAVN